jgi:hypothetical protein
MLVVQCILWVLNMACACSSTNRIWPINAFAALVITAQVASQGL